MPFLSLTNKKPLNLIRINILKLVEAMGTNLKFIDVKNTTIYFFRCSFSFSLSIRLLNRFQTNRFQMTLFSSGWLQREKIIRMKSLETVILTKLVTSWRWKFFKQKTVESCKICHCPFCVIPSEKWEHQSKWTHEYKR